MWGWHIHGNLWGGPPAFIDFGTGRIFSTGRGSHNLYHCTNFGSNVTGSCRISLGVTKYLLPSITRLNFLPSANLSSWSLSKNSLKAFLFIWTAKSGYLLPVITQGIIPSSRSFLNYITK